MLKSASKQKHWYSLFESFCILWTFWSCPGLYLRINSGLRCWESSHSVLLGKHLLSHFTPVSFVKAVVHLVEQQTWPAWPCRTERMTPHLVYTEYVHAYIHAGFCTVEEATCDCFFLRWMKRGSVRAVGGEEWPTVWQARHWEPIRASFETGVKVIIYELVYLVALQPAVCCPVLAAFPSKASLWVTGQNSTCSLLV